METDLFTVYDRVARAAAARYHIPGWDTEDAYQEAWVVMLESKRIDYLGLRSRVFLHMRDRLKSEKYKSKRTKRLLPDPGFEPDVYDQTVAEIRSTLTGEDLELFDLSFVRELPGSIIAALMCMGEEAVRQARTRLKKKIREFLSQTGGDKHN